MWIGNTVYFRSDRDGEFNIYAYDADTRQVRALTEFNDFPVLVGGHACGALQFPGHHVALAGDNVSRVALTCLRALGVPVEGWGSDQFATSAPIDTLLV